ncbi:hypothetical protein L1887_04252 [Cichorium endivia]|nr:hypothetical protein L1887_04252 [Cichorium endivia]
MEPVHPKFGAFWGMGIGVGCGIGWGPGFGPDVIGYVSADCGVGFSVGLLSLPITMRLPRINNRTDTYTPSQERGGGDDLQGIDNLDLDLPDFEVVDKGVEVQDKDATDGTQSESR